MAHPNLDGLSLDDEGEEGFCFDFDDVEDEQVELRWCLVGRFLCERAVHFNSMKVRMADLWKPVKGVTIKEASAGKFLFHFAHPLDMEAVLNGGPWSFDNNMLLLEQVQIGMQVEQIPLFHVNMWVQVHNLPMGLMKEKNGIQLANYIGAFVEYDKNNNSSFWRQYMRLKVKVDVRQPLKRNTKVKNKEGGWCVVQFKYEKLGMFCFVCGIMGHTENKCEVRFAMEHDDGVREWSNEIRAEPRRQGGRLASRWLREEIGGRQEQSSGERAAQPHSPSAFNRQGPTSADVEVEGRSHIIDNSSPDKPKQLTWAGQSSSNQPGTTKHLFPINSNHSAPANVSNGTPTIHPAINTIKTNLISPYFLADNINSNIPSLYDTWTSQQQRPITINIPETETNKPQLLPNQAITFSSQPVIKVPPRTTLPNKKITRGPNNNHTARAKASTSLTRFNLPDPSSTQVKPETKKPKIPRTETGPILNPTKLTENQEKEDMEVQGEKKRRREDDMTAVNNEETEHFLTAGPGSQDCRDQ
jgi:hypothetical protein